MTDGINYDAFSEALNDKADRDLQNVDTSSGGDAVIAFQRPTAENGYTWYRKYKSGWVEQGGRTAKNVSHPSVVFPIVMANTDYHCNTTIRNDGSGSGGGFNNCSGIDSVSTTGLKIDMPASSDYFVLWQVSGMAAQ